MSNTYLYGGPSLINSRCLWIWDADCVDSVRTYLQRGQRKGTGNDAYKENKLQQIDIWIGKIETTKVNLVVVSWRK